MKAVAFWDRGKTGVAGDGSRAEVPWYVACHRVPPRATACHRLQPTNTASNAAYGTPPPPENKKLNTRTTVGWFCFFCFVDVVARRETHLEVTLLSPPMLASSTPLLERRRGLGFDTYPPTSCDSIEHGKIRPKKGGIKEREQREGG